MNAVLVTGATGMIGRYAVACLQRVGWRVEILARQKSTTLPAVHVADLGDKGTLEALLRRLKCSHLLHLGWVTSHGTYWHSGENLDCVAGSMILFRAFAEAGGRRIVAAGTCAEYDWTLKDIEHANIGEDTPCKPHTLYGVSKLATQTLLAAFAEQTGISWAWGRVFLPFGAGEDPRRLVPSVILSLLADRPAMCSEGKQVRDFIDFEDTGRAFAQVLKSDVKGIINIGSGQPISEAEMALLIGKLMARSDLVRLGALPTRPDDPPRLVADVTRLRDEVGFKTQYSVTDSLKRAIDELKKGCRQRLESR